MAEWQHLDVVGVTGRIGIVGLDVLVHGDRDREPCVHCFACGPSSSG